MDYHIDMLLDIKSVRKKLPKLKCIVCVNKPKLKCIVCVNMFCNCTSKRDCNHLGEEALHSFKKKKATSTNVCSTL